MVIGRLPCEIIYAGDYQWKYPGMQVPAPGIAKITEEGGPRKRAESSVVTHLDSKLSK